MPQTTPLFAAGSMHAKIHYGRFHEKRPALLRCVSQAQEASAAGRPSLQSAWIAQRTGGRCYGGAICRRILTPRPNPCERQEIYGSSTQARQSSSLAGVSRRAAWRGRQEMCCQPVQHPRLRQAFLEEICAFQSPELLSPVGNGALQWVLAG